VRILNEGLNIKVTYKLLGYTKEIDVSQSETSFRLG